MVREGCVNETVWGWRTKTARTPTQRVGASFRPGFRNVVALQNPSRPSASRARRLAALTEPATLQSRVTAWPENCRGGAGWLRLWRSRWSRWYPVLPSRSLEGPVGWWRSAPGPSKEYAPLRERILGPARHTHRPRSSGGPGGPRQRAARRRTTSRAPRLYTHRHTSVPSASRTAQERVLPSRAMRIACAPLRRGGRACALPRVALLLRQFFDGHEVHTERIA